MHAQHTIAWHSRLGAKVKDVAEEMQIAGKSCSVISMMPLAQIADAEASTLALQTTWNRDEPHITSVYQFRGVPMLSGKAEATPFDNHNKSPQVEPEAAQYPTML